jgi:hypothetical protein
MTNFFFLLFWPFFRFLILRVVMLISWRYFRFRDAWYFQFRDATSDCLMLFPIPSCDIASDSVYWCYIRFCLLTWSYFWFHSLTLLSILFLDASSPFESMYIPFLWIYIYLNCFCFWQANKVNDYYYICDIWEYYLFCTIFSMYMEKGLFVKC